MPELTATKLPPGPRLPKWMQTAGFIFFNRPWIDGCRRRYGDMVTFSSLFDPRFVMVFEPELVKQVFRGSPEQLRAGEANAVLGPVVGERSVLLLDGAEHMRQRKLLLPPFHGQRMRAYEEVMREAADRAIDSWPVGEEFALLPSMQALTARGDHAHGLRVRGRRPQGRAPAAHTGDDRPGVATDGRRAARAVRRPLRHAQRGRTLRAAPRRARRAAVRGDRAPPRGAGPRGARRRLLDAGAGARRGRPRDVRPRAPRRTSHAARGGPRDHGHRTG